MVLLFRIMPTTKEFKTIDEQIALLKERHLKFRNVAAAKKALLKYNYFDLINGFESIYAYTRTPIKDYKNTYFEDFLNSYKFDQKLKNLTLAKLFDIEVRLRTSISYHFSELYCRGAPNTMNYLNRVYYQAPPSSDRHLTNTFNNFTLFKITHRDPTTGTIEKGFIDSAKDKSPYMAAYVFPPFWISIKTMTFGSLYYLFVFLPQILKEQVVQDFGFLPSEINHFIQAIAVLKEARNQCAHLELITRFKLKPDVKLNRYNDIRRKANLSTSDFFYFDILRILNLFCEIKTIKKFIKSFYIKQKISFRKKIAIKLLSKMGRPNISTWMHI